MFPIFCSFLRFFASAHSRMGPSGNSCKPFSINDTNYAAGRGVDRASAPSRQRASRLILFEKIPGAITFAKLCKRFL